MQLLNEAESSLQVLELCTNHHLPVRNLQGSCSPWTKLCQTYTAVQIVRLTLLMLFLADDPAGPYHADKVKS